MVEDPPADVVTRLFVFAPGISQAKNQFHRLLFEDGASRYFDSPSPSSSSFVLRMSSGSAPGSAPSATATGSASTFGAETTAIVASASSSTSTPSGTFKSLTWIE